MAIGQVLESEAARPPSKWRTLPWPPQSREAALALRLRYRDLPAIQRGFDGAPAASSEQELHRLRPQRRAAALPEAAFLARLPPFRPARGAPILAANSKGQPGLWPYGISGDYPILLLRLGSSKRS